MGASVGCLTIFVYLLVLFVCLIGLFKMSDGLLFSTCDEL